ncbi:FAD-dependent oxidoreductase [Marinactinospora thermotolerans]|uniref:2-polyprenyl-6-methoxyphenol hydroxylase n=1 Tax=Marinactinospora thermotolerans DSM 45154 TaxID=1122192 RepID=A0A1T4TFN9_9ACTN|nr:FAD-dependent oxidoreductase [Marinactinospora thermotolerans]SKA39111.1 2-polyprenyl-6-methoxyphenol hydroxylase [Marinactinospora thermotolerans DSM 45154]
MTRHETTTCAIAGGGPAGIVLGLLLARAGVEVVVLEKHADFLRDFRGDTVHPSTLELMDELGLGERLEHIPHSKIRRIGIQAGPQGAIGIDLKGMPGAYQHVAMIPQWDFLDMLADEARRHPEFTLRMRSEAIGLLDEDGAVRGVRYRDADGEHELRATLTVAADGRRSTLRVAAGLTVRDLGAPMDVLWVRVSRAPTDPTGLLGRIGTGNMAAAIDRGTYWQIAYLIPKGSYHSVRAAGLPSLQEAIRRLLPFLAERVAEIDSWEHVAFLEVGLDRLADWYRPGLLCIGDAAHTMSPIGGVGINLAVQDAVATANLLAVPLLRAQEDPDRFARTLNPALLARVQRRRLLPTAATQAIQRALQRRIIGRALDRRPRIPPALRALLSSPAGGMVVGRVMMYGIRPEHVRSPGRSGAREERTTREPATAGPPLPGQGAASPPGRGPDQPA